MVAGTLDELAGLIPRSTLLFNEPMSRHTSFRIGGPADLLVVPSGIEDVRTCVGFCQNNGIPWLVMGNGTNLLVRDGGIRGVVVRIAGTMDDVQQDGLAIVCGAGAPLRDVSSFAAGRSLSGLEFACGIPGTVGGALVMNAGAYGGEMKDVVESVEVLTEEGELRTMRGDTIGFSYRHSVFQESGDIVVAARFSLKPGDRPDIQRKMGEFTARRRERQPLDRPSAGSVFRRPEGAFVGTLVEKAGLKGHRIGGAAVSEVHAGFIINCGDATARDVLRLMEHVQDVVFREYGVRLVPELKIVGEP
ncbi:MAG: UDP-N-acetylmuramate dehydrogenase [Firmicutes bacterium]|jgi:UDP-N-acetylmuramate dehydrogenase|nr:UDP-N-acetylmuramate dehydrogenase [Bacillota bacterium]